MLSREFRFSSELNGAKALLHASLAESEGSGAAPVSHRLAAFEWEPAAGGLSLACELVRQEAGAAGACLVRRLRYRGAYRSDAAGGTLTEIGTETVAELPSEPFVPTRPEHRARAFVHRWLWAWENAGDAAAFDELLSNGHLDVRFHSGEPIGSRAAFLEAVRRLAGGAGPTHHRLGGFTLDVLAEAYVVTAVVAWRGTSSGGTPLRAKTRHSWELLEEGTRFPRLRRLRTELLEPLRAELPEEATGPEVPNSPSDDAEAGGP